MKPSILAIAGLLALSACATAPTVYAPAAGPQSPGYSELRIEPGRYRITFRGGGGAPVEQVADYALLRAADLALAEGYDWFRVVDRVTRQAAPNSGPRVSLGAGGGPGPYRSGVGVGLGTSFDLGGGPAVAQTIEVLMGRGAKPTERDVYDAREVRRMVGARA
ncbi:MAG: CC0125/CC1285 family lipoprotein [Phenylobacterium sp.]|uniref:CC0125/CC1285 family lipoprotein n=1 Tax=Phenylobacterium sp. TaxID=1871053 RepID=UPI003918F1C7